MQDKTNAMRILDAKKISYEVRRYGDGKTALSGSEVASILGLNPDKVFKTLVTVGASRAHYVFMVPVEAELDLKKAASAVKEKSVSMIAQKELLPLTGYVHGGCSPVGMKKSFPTVIHFTAENFDTIVFSGGRIGLQLEMPCASLSLAVKLEKADIIR